jgi:hypothetical protein
MRKLAFIAGLVALTVAATPMLVFGRGVFGGKSSYNYICKDGKYAKSAKDCKENGGQR